MTNKISKHFTYDEFMCKCGCGTMKVDAAFLQALERLREYINTPIIVTSGYRCPKHKETITRPNSYHALGMAADIAAPEMDLLELYFAADRIRDFREGGIGFYPNCNFIHVDIRPQYARWGYMSSEYVNIIDAIYEYAN